MDPTIINPFNQIAQQVVAMVGSLVEAKVEVVLSKHSIKHMCMHKSWTAFCCTAPTLGLSDLSVLLQSKKKLKEIDYMDDDTKLKRWDMIYRRLDTQHDLCICEDKPEAADHSETYKDQIKCDEQRINMLRCLERNSAMKELVPYLESITAQTHGLSILIRGRKKIGNSYVHYTKAQGSIPGTPSSQCAALSEFLTIIISLKLQIATEAISEYHVKYLDNDSESQESMPESKGGEREREMIRQMKEEERQACLDVAKETMKNVVLGDDVLVARDHEILLMLALRASNSKDLRTNNISD
ncbi:hypothetical protein INT45_010419 [Circinella minor]|uniref:Uncharacterized protein n=1 Tax=Circinella minor TaxID=1195481 RepID=A0A8H7RYS6_9FUNG|nr:hypothetical protein INT45_010419 [Circinella minor]